MSLGRQLLNGADPCVISKRWKIHPELAVLAIELARKYHERTGDQLFIISGYRDRRKQNALRKAGRPAAPIELSNHTICPARALDVQTGLAPTSNIKGYLGAAAAGLPLRWGGGSPPDSNGIPSDWNHFDLGPRTDPEAEAFRASQRP